MVNFSNTFTASPAWERRRLVGKKSGLRAGDIGDILDYVCSIAHRWKVYYLWRPFLRDPKVPKVKPDKHDLLPA